MHYTMETIRQAVTAGADAIQVRAAAPDETSSPDLEGVRR